MRELTIEELELVSGGTRPPTPGPKGIGGGFETNLSWMMQAMPNYMKGSMEAARRKMEEQKQQLGFAGTLTGSYTSPNGLVNCLYSTPIGGFGDYNNPPGYTCPQVSKAPKTI